MPLWSERGLVGALFLGEKRQGLRPGHGPGDLYTREEIEIARATGERLIDARASAEMARRLMALQRQGLAQTQLLDRRARRALHDDVLPGLHAAMLSLDDASSGPALDLLADVHRALSNLLHEMPATTARAVKRLGLLEALRRTVEDELGGAFDDVAWRVDAQRPLRLAIEATWEDGLTIAVEDDGVGLQPGEAPAGGHGLALHTTMMAVIGGTLAVDGTPDARTRVSLTVPEQVLDLYRTAAQRPP